MSSAVMLLAVVGFLWLASVFFKAWRTERNGLRPWKSKEPTVVGTVLDIDLKG